MVVSTSTLPFTQQLALTLIPPVIAIATMPLVFYFMIRYMPKLIQMMKGLYREATNDYRCQCARCQEELKTKRGIKKFMKAHKFKRKDWV